MHSVLLAVRFLCSFFRGTTLAIRGVSLCRHGYQISHRVNQRSDSLALTRLLSLSLLNTPYDVSRHVCSWQPYSLESPIVKVPYIPVRPFLSFSWHRLIYTLFR